MKKFVSAFLTVLMVFSMLSASFVSASAATYSESESNDSYSTADSISTGNSITGNLSSSSDVDYYKIVPSSNGKLTITFNHTYNSAYASWNVKVYYYSNGTYNELSSNNIWLTDSEQISLPSIGAAANGVYYVHVSRGTNSTVGYKYTISTSFSSTNYWEREMNNSYQTATSVSGGHTYSACLSNSDDMDYFKIQASTTGTIGVSFNHTYDSAYASWNVKVYYYSNGTYNELSSNNIWLTDSEQISLPSIGAAANGVYYVRVSRGTNSTVGYEYSISITGSTSGSSSSSANLSLSSSSITINKGETASVTCSYSGTISGNARLSYSITGTSGVVSATWGSWSNNSVPITFEGLKAGTTTVRIYLKNTSDYVYDYEDITITVVDNTSNGNGSGNGSSDSGFSVFSIFNWLIEFINMIISLFSMIS